MSEVAPPLRPVVVAPPPAAWVATNFLKNLFLARSVSASRNRAPGPGAPAFTSRKTFDEPRPSAPPRRLEYLRATSGCGRVVSGDRLRHLSLRSWQCVGRQASALLKSCPSRSRTHPEWTVLPFGRSASAWESFGSSSAQCEWSARLVANDVRGEAAGAHHGSSTQQRRIQQHRARPDADDVDSPVRRLVLRFFRIGQTCSRFLTRRLMRSWPTSSSPARCGLRPARRLRGGDGCSEVDESVSAGRCRAVWRHRTSARVFHVKH